MPVDMDIWKDRIKQASRGLADEDMQRRAWFGIGPEVSSPTEDICQLIDDTHFEDYLDRKDNGLNRSQIDAGKNLANAIRMHSERHKLRPAQMIDDPRWVKIRAAAKQFLESLN